MCLKTFIELRSQPWSFVSLCALQSFINFPHMPRLLQLRVGLSRDPKQLNAEPFQRCFNLSMLTERKTKQISAALLLICPACVRSCPVSKSVEFFLLSLFLLLFIIIIKAVLLTV